MDACTAPAETFTPEAAPAPTGAPDISEEHLLGLTAKAAEKVLEIKQAEGIGDDYGLRLRVVGGGCSGFSYDLYFDQALDGVDRNFSSHGIKLLVDHMSLQYLIGTEIDYVEGLMGAGFKFNNPNVKGTCGCGSSFNV